MQNDGFRPQITFRGRRLRGPSGLLTRILAVVGGLLMLVGAVAISIVVFAFALVAVVLFGLYIGWKNRDVIRQMRAARRRAQSAFDERPPSPFDNGNVIEGEVVRKEDRPHSGP